MTITSGTAVCLALAALMFSPATTSLRAGVVTWGFESPLEFTVRVDGPNNTSLLTYGFLSGSFRFDASTDTYSDANFILTSPGYFPDQFAAPFAITGGGCLFRSLTDASTFCVRSLSLNQSVVEVTLSNPLPDTNTSGSVDDIASAFIDSYVYGGPGSGSELISSPEPGTALISVLGVLSLISRKACRKYIHGKRAR